MSRGPWRPWIGPRSVWAAHTPYLWSPRRSPALLIGLDHETLWSGRARQWSLFVCLRTYQVPPAWALTWSLSWRWHRQHGRHD